MLSNKVKKHLGQLEQKKYRKEFKEFIEHEKIYNFLYSLLTKTTSNLKPKYVENKG